MCFDRLSFTHTHSNICRARGIIIIYYYYHYIIYFMYARQRRCHRSSMYIYNIFILYMVKIYTYIISYIYLVTPTGVRASGRNGLSARGVRIVCRRISHACPFYLVPFAPTDAVSTPPKPTPPQVTSRSCGKCKHPAPEFVAHTLPNAHRDYIL